MIIPIQPTHGEFETVRNGSTYSAIRVFSPQSRPDNTLCDTRPSKFIHTHSVIQGVEGPWSGRCIVASSPSHRQNRMGPLFPWPNPRECSCTCSEMDGHCQEESDQTARLSRFVGKAGTIVQSPPTIRGRDWHTHSSTVLPSNAYRTDQHE